MASISITGAAGSMSRVTTARWWKSTPAREQVTNQWPIAGVPDVTFFNPATGLVHVAIGKPGLVQSIDPRTGASTQTKTAAGRIRRRSRRRTGCTCFHRRIAERWLWWMLRA